MFKSKTDSEVLLRDLKGHLGYLFRPLSTVADPCASCVPSIEMRGDLGARTSPGHLCVCAPNKNPPHGRSAMHILHTIICLSPY